MTAERLRPLWILRPCTCGGSSAEYAYMQVNEFRDHPTNASWPSPGGVNHTHQPTLAPDGGQRRISDNEARLAQTVAHQNMGATIPHVCS